MQLFVQNQQDKIPVTEDLLGLLRLISELVLKPTGLPPDAEVGITLVDDETIQHLNQEYRGIDSPTDVLSFAMQEETGEEPAFRGAEEEYLLGDVIVSMETAFRQAKEAGHPLARELGWLAVHGLLHLLGYDHQTAADEERMRLKEREVLAAAGISG